MKAAETAALAALDAALLDADERGLRVPCVGRGEEFTADDTNALQRAARDCVGCPAFAACAAVVPFVWHGAWAGVVVARTR